MEPAPDVLPDYAPMLKAFHEGFRAELKAIIQSLPFHSDFQVADVGCGDGFYTRLLAERLGAKGLATGIDANRAYLDIAKYNSAEGPLRWVEGTLDELPLGKFDLVWCAQSLFSFPEPKAALRKMAAALKPNGILAVLENDTLHQCLLPWPSDLELREGSFSAIRAYGELNLSSTVSNSDADRVDAFDIRTAPTELQANWVNLSV